MSDRVNRKAAGIVAAFTAFLLFGALASLPWLANRHARSPWVRAAQSAAPVRLAASPARVAPVTLSASVRPADPSGPRQAPATGDPAHQAALVVTEDRRLRSLLHRTARVSVPSVIATRGGLPTLVLPARPTPYEVGDLKSAGAIVSIPGQGSALLVDDVLVGTGATLDIDSAATSTILMNSGAEGFTSIVSWGGVLKLAGSPGVPLTIQGWDSVARTAATDTGYGRPYIRAVGGRMQVDYVHESSLGFWSGRTGGIAWTGISSQTSTGGASDSTFTGNMYGAFVSRTQGMKFSNDLFESNELDGLRLHRGTTGAVVTASAAARNGANGFVIDRGATDNALTRDLSINNGGNGFLLDGRPLVHGASPSGGRTSESGGTLLSDSEADSNGKAGVLVEGGTRPVVQRNLICASAGGIALRSGASDTVVNGNDVSCGGRVALSIGPDVAGTTVTGNTLSAARIGVLIHSASGVRLLNNSISGMSVFGLSIRGSAPGVVGDSNVISGRGFRAVDVRAGAVNPLLTTTDATAWLHRSRVTPWLYLRYHPILLLWVCIIALVLLASIMTRLRRHRRQPGLYAHRFGHEDAHRFGHEATSGRHAERPIPLRPGSFVAAPALAAAAASGHERRAKGVAS